MPVIAPDTPAPRFALPSTLAGPVSLEDLLAAGPARVMFVTDDCPTCELALRRVAAAGAAVTVVCEAGPAAAARLAHRTAFRGVMLSEPAPYETSRAYGLDAVPTTLAIGVGGEVAAAVVGWDAVALTELLGVDLTGEAPLRKPGCAAKSSYDAVQLAADIAAPARTTPRRSTSWGLPTACRSSRRRPSGLRRCSPAAIPAVARRGAAGNGVGDARAGGGVRRPGRLPARALRRRRRRGRGHARARVQPARPGGDHAAVRADRRRQRPGSARRRPELWHGRARPRHSRECDHRPRRAAARCAHRRGHARAARPLDARPAGQGGGLRGRGRGTQPVAAAARRAWVPAGRVGRDHVRRRRAAVGVRASQPHAG